jgi:2,4-dienoyl-CoA reductase-like NADH-dependent reductase (Old Yellow Enzyme family)
MISFYAARAKGGAGLLIVEATCIDAPIGLVMPGELRIDADRFTPGHSDLTEAVHSFGAKIALQIHHAGWRGYQRLAGGLTPVAPSAVAITGSNWTPRELTIAEIDDIINKFVDGGLRAKLAGYDAVEIHGSSH